MGGIGECGDTTPTIELRSFFSTGNLSHPTQLDQHIPGHSAVAPYAPRSDLGPKIIPDQKHPHAAQHHTILPPSPSNPSLSLILSRVLNIHTAPQRLLSAKGTSRPFLRRSISGNPDKPAVRRHPMCPPSLAFATCQCHSMDRDHPSAGGLSKLSDHLPPQMTTNEMHVFCVSLPKLHCRCRHSSW